ncbi:MAG: (Fe-S)-binding protein [Pyrobaculum sp.]
MNRQQLLEEVKKCQFCGFCEHVCPTLNATRTRHFGPRGRINIILKTLANGEKIGDDVFAGIATCLNCRACNTQCPAGIKIAEAIHSFKILLLKGELS